MRISNPTVETIARRRLRRGFNDLIGYLTLINPTTVVHKDGALSRHYRFVAPDLNSSTSDELDYHASSWQNAMAMLGDGWMLETNVISLPLRDTGQGRDFPDPVSALLDEERRLQQGSGQYFSSTSTLSISYRPEKLLDAKLRRFALEGVSTAETEGMEAILSTFEKVTQEVLGYLSRSLLSINPLERDNLISFLAQCITGNAQHLRMPFDGAFLDCYLALDDFIGGFAPRLGNKHISVLAIDELPVASCPALLDELSQLPLTYRWHSRLICLDKLTAQGYLKQYERAWSSKAIGLMGVLRESLGLPAKRDADAQATADNIAVARDESRADQLGFGFFNGTLILMDECPERLSETSDALVTFIQQLDFKVRVESVNAVEAYLGSLPGHGDYNLRKMLVDTRFVSHALPTSALYQGESQAPCAYQGYESGSPLLFTGTRGNRPFWLNLHVGDVGHTAILGPTGGGKSVLNAAIIAAHRQYSGSRIVVLDKDRSNEVILRALNGNYIALEEAPSPLAPLARVTLGSTASQDRAVAWLTLCCQAQGIILTPNEKQELVEAVKRLANEPQNFKNLDHLTLQTPSLRQAMNSLNSGTFGRLLNGTAPPFAHTDVLGIDAGALLNRPGQEAQTVPVIQALFDELEEIFQDRRPTFLVLEEAWQYIKHEAFSAKLTDWFKTLRKLNVAVVFISQDLTDIMGSPAASVIQSSCLTRIFLPNPAANEPAIRDSYEQFGLSSRQIDLIRHATRKRDYYYCSPLGNSLFQLNLGELAQAFYCVSKKADIDKFIQCLNEEGNKWLSSWLNYCGLHEWQQLAKKY